MKLLVLLLWTISTHYSTALVGFINSADMVEEIGEGKPAELRVFH